MRLTKREQKNITQQRINYLFDQAEQVFTKDPKLSNRYVKIAIDLHNKFKVRFTKSQKARFCKKCHSFLKPGSNCIVRTKNKMILFHCKKCDYIRKQGIRVVM